MGSSTERREGDPDISQPGIRQIHGWIRDRSNVSIDLVSGGAINGVIRWVDLQFLAVEPAAGGELLLINRDAIVLIRGGI
ncbi:MAG: Hfq-related RNA-binding protein [Vulcanococcus sp.]